MLYSSAEHHDWAPFTNDYPVAIFDFDGSTLPAKFVQPYLDWRRDCEATSPGECFTEPALTCFPPKLYRELICSPFYSVALQYLRTPDPWSAAVAHRMQTRHGQRVVTFADALASAIECIRVTLPGQHERPSRWSAFPVAMRAWNHIHLLMHWLVPAYSAWTEEALTKRAADGDSAASGRGA